VAQLVRKEITLTAEDAAALERVARELGVSESTVLRKSIRSLLEDHENAQRTSALQRLFALAEQYAGGITPADSAGQHRWTRDELYDRIYRPVAG
jgi:hypothetical protein